MTKTTPQDLQVFQIITDFVGNLHEFFGEKKSNYSGSRALVMYNRLISKMTFNDQDMILRHIDVFRQFCKGNRERILARNSEFNTPMISFTEKIYINMNHIFKTADKDTSQVIWEYLLSIAAHVDPESGSKDILKQLQTVQPQEQSPFAGLAGLDPSMLSGMMSMMSTMLPAGGGDSVNSLLETVQNSNIDFDAIGKTLTGVVETVKNELGKSDDPTIQQMLGLMDTMLPQLQQTNE